MMNETELFQLMIVNAIEKAIQPLREDLKQIKALNVKLLKEQANIIAQAPLQTVAQPLNKAGSIYEGFKPIGRPSAPTESPVVVSDQQAFSLLSQAAQYARTDGDLPDVDIPIEMFLKRK